MWLFGIGILLFLGSSWCYQCCPNLYARSLSIHRDLDSTGCYHPSVLGPKMFMGQPFTGFRRQLFDDRKIVEYEVEAKQFPQKLDHFDSTNDLFWNQRYWNNMKFSKPNGPQFFIMGQEMPQGAFAVTDETAPFMIWAKNVSAGVWTLEHRFYGESRPFEKQTVENLKYLSSRQYLADVANFIQTQNQNLNLTDPKWVVFGGSYAGSLALWFRELYPELAAGAVGSSGPVQPVLDFYEFFQFVENSITTRDQKCAKKTKAAFQQLQNYMEFTLGRKKLDEIFHNDDDLKMLNLTSDNIENFYLTIIGYFEQAVQYDCGKNCPFGINNLCKIMNDDTNSLLVNLGQVVKLLPQLMDFNIGSQHKYSDMVNFLKYDGYDNRIHAAYRSWTWQTCNEFGFYTTTDGGQSFFGSKVTTNYFIDLCMDVFGEEFNVDHIKAGIEKTLKLYGGADNYFGTNVVAPRGSLDPWSALALKTSSDPSVIPYLVEGGSHCSDMGSPSENDNESLKNLRALIIENIKKWIGVSPINNVTTMSKTTEYVEKRKKVFVSEIKWSNVTEFFEHIPSKRSRNFRIRTILRRETLKKNVKLMKITENRISQPVDHFNKSDSRIWSQRFWNNSAFYKHGGPIFLMIGGEDDGGAHEIYDADSHFLVMAKRFQADTYYIEHRGYGKSLPANDSSVSNLKYISSEQALADMANFIEAINEIRPNSKWITHGGSYPGSLSAWFREKYPEMTVGAVASSAPLLPKVDFFEYLQVVQNVFYEFNPKCAENLKAAFADVQIKLYSIEGRKKINKLFHVSLLGRSPNITEIRNFLDDLIGFVGVVQYGSDLSSYCKTMTNNSNTPIENLAALNRRGKMDYAEDVLDEENDDLSWNAGRTWLWQTCTEFGWYQSTDMGARNMFGAATPVDYIIGEECLERFGKNITDIAAGVEYSLKNYGGLDNYNATNIVLVNGSHDPWHALGLYTNNTSPTGITSILINGTSHCRDMDISYPDDPPQLKAARQKINELIAEWLK